MKTLARLLNNTFYLISLRIRGLLEIDLSKFNVDKNDLKELKIFNEKFTQRLERLLSSIQLRDYLIFEPDYLKSEEMIDNFTKFISCLANNDLRHIWEQLMASIVLIEDNKLLFEKLSKNPGSRLKWYLYTINLLYRVLQKTILKFQSHFPDVSPQMKYQKKIIKMHLIKT